VALRCRSPAIFTTLNGPAVINAKARQACWSKIVISAPFMGVHWNIAIMLVIEKPEWCGYPMAEKI